MRKLLLIFLISMTGTGWIYGGDLNIDKFHGTWEVDFDRTMAAAKESPEVTAEEAERLPEMIKRMMATMKIKVADNEMIYLRGGREIAVPLEVERSDEKSVTTVVKRGDQETTLVFNLVEESLMNIRSSASDDMDFYVWKKTAKPETGKDLAVIMPPFPPGFK